MGKIYHPLAFRSRFWSADAKRRDDVELVAGAKGSNRFQSRNILRILVAGLVAVAPVSRFHAVSRSVMTALEVPSRPIATENIGKGPLKVVILTGQSNMVGQGNGAHLDELINIEKRPELRHLQNLDGSWAQRDDVYVAMDFHNKTGPLTAVGFGKDGVHEFGPEVGIGWVIGEAVEDQVLLLKVANGGVSLATSFRPPSSGWDYARGKPKLENGWFYREMMGTILHTLDNIETLGIPNYDPEVGYVLSGVVFLQGWADAKHLSTVYEYENNLCNFIRDVRDDLSAPDLPFVIGEQGSMGPTVKLIPTDKKDAKHIALRQIQRNVTERDEFRHNTRFSPIADIVYAKGAHYQQRADIYYEMGRRLGEKLSEIML